ncbi:MAG: MOSC N-terminal beta barrel domain-containing protein [Pseudomonadota bacterium]
MSENSNAVSVGRVVGLWRYPVKSMAAEALRKVDVSWHGLLGDRRWAFIRNNSVRSGFPWFTLRQRSDMNNYVPSFVDPANTETSRTVVQTPAGDVLDIDDPALGLSLCPEGSRVIRQSRGIFDTFPISLITTQTIARLGEIVGDELDVLRFRPNILVEADGGEPFSEDCWVGQVLRIGEMRMRVDQRDGRCVVITIDPATGERNPAVLRAVKDQRQQRLGVYGSTVEPGCIALQDEVQLEVPASGDNHRSDAQI